MLKMKHEKCTIPDIIGSTLKGRDPMFKCDKCGKFIAYDDIPDKVKIEHTVDSENTIEETVFTHLHCL